VPSFGILGIGGTAAFLVGSLILWDEQAVGYQIPLALILGVTAFSALVFIGISVMAVRMRGDWKPIVDQGMYGTEGVVKENFVGEGWVKIGPEFWKARSVEPLREGERVRVVARSGLTVEVVPVEKSPVVQLQKEKPHA